MIQLTQKEIMQVVGSGFNSTIAYNLFINKQPEWLPNGIISGFCTVLARQNNIRNVALQVVSYVGCFELGKIGGEAGKIFLSVPLIAEGLYYPYWRINNLYYSLAYGQCAPYAYE